MTCGLVLALPATAFAARGSGGATASQRAAIKAVSCIAGCAGAEAVQPGSLLRVRGTGMREVAQVVFLGAKGYDDNVVAAVIKARVKSVDVVVPDPATSGPLRAIKVDGTRSRASRAVVSVKPGARSSAALEVRVVGSRVFYDAARPAQVDLVAKEAMAVTVALVRVADGAPIAFWPVALLPGVLSSVTWDGRVDGLPMPVGRYEFRVYNQAAAGAQAAQAPVALATGAFDLVDHKFPVRGKHDYGEGEAAFGAGRGGHAHQGHDVFAACGTLLVAARGGVVKLNQSHAAAGNYLVIDGDGTEVDYVYMHMREPSPLTKGVRVLTGQPIGHVGDTGRAHGCHLHFELWGPPGWFTGGQPFDPLPFLQAWDAYS